MLFAVQEKSGRGFEGKRVTHLAEAPVRCRCSGAGPRSPGAFGPSRNPPGWPLSSAGSPTVSGHIEIHQLTRHDMGGDRYAGMDTHTQPRPFYVSRPDKKQSNTQKIRTREPYSASAGCVNLLTFFLTSFFFLSSSFIFFSCLIWARRCFLRSSSAFKSLLSDMVSFKRE